MTSKQIKRISLLNMLPKDSIGAEIGVWKGSFSQEILNIIKPKILYLIDPWKYMPKYTQRLYGRKAYNQKYMNRIFLNVKKKFKKYDNVRIIRKTSNACVKDFDNFYFDWVYIAGDHSYAFVMADLCNYIDKVKIGGYITGDDYNCVSVKQAVDTFITTQKNKVIFSTLYNQFIIERIM